MIRRDHRDAEGQQHWLLVPQAEHARLSGEMALAWGAAPFERPEPADQLLPALFHHDDGWTHWDRRPEVDPASGRPLNFTEMPLAESLPIWQRSIYTATDFGPLAGWVVSGHFAALLEHRNAWQPTSASHGTVAGGFLSAQSALRSELLAQWQRGHEKVRIRAIAERALQFVQFFDALSLWLCMAERTSPHTMPVPGGPELTLIPRTPREIELKPWPLVVPEIVLGLPARSVPVAQYGTPADLAAARGVTVMLDWRLVPATSAV
jgi:hypothetical protein